MSPSKYSAADAFPKSIHFPRPVNVAENEVVLSQLQRQRKLKAMIPYWGNIEGKKPETSE